MTNPDAAPRSVVIEQEMPYDPEKIWRALADGALMAEWLMQNDFRPVVGHWFTFRSTPSPHWNGIVESEVLIVEPNARLAYSWNSSGGGAATSLQTVVTWTLTPTGGGTLVRMEQTGFRPDDTFAQQGAVQGWKRMVAGLEQVTARVQ